MQKYCFSIRTRSGQFIERISIAGKNRDDAERKLNQMYRYCEVVSCDENVRQNATRQQDLSIEELLSVIPR